MMKLAGGTLNLDANYGTPAGVVEMLMQSHDGDVHLLPALPDEWKGGRLVKAEILSSNGGEIRSIRSFFPLDLPFD